MIAMNAFLACCLCICSVFNTNMPHEPRNVQAPNTAADFWTQWRSVNPRMVTFVLITPQSFWTGVSSVGLTSNTRDMTLPGHPGVTFKSAPGVMPTVVEQLLDDPTNLEMTGIYQTGIFEQTDVVAGKWNFATIEIFSACWNNTDLGELLHFKGKLGEVKDYQYFFTAEGRGLINLLSQEVTPVTARFCRVKEFRDAQCGHVAATVTIGAATYTIVHPTVLVIDDAQLTGGTLGLNTVDFTGTTPIAGLFTNGKVTADTGANAGVSREIAYNVGDLDGIIRLALKRPFPFAFDVNTDTVTVTVGCNRTIEDCIKFSNIVNRRAEDFIPTIEAANRIPPSN